MHEISSKRFDVYMSFRRHTLLYMMGEEIKWYENDSRTLFAVVVWDYTDCDYNCIILGRDKNNRARAIDMKISINDLDTAERWVLASAKKLEESGQTQFEQGDEANKNLNLFSAIVGKSKVHPYYDILNTKPTHTAAKNLIAEVTPHFFDVDGNFVEQFQTDGFDSRLWELYLFCFFNEQHLDIDRTHNAPDFMLSRGDVEVALEAVIVGRKSTPTEFRELGSFRKAVDVEEETRNAMPIRYGSPLFSKLTHTNKAGSHYWEYPHTLGKPFVIAIADFHEDFSMTWSTTALITYLYGYRYSHYYEENGTLVVNSEKIQFHENQETGKKIPSGFFFQPGTENISAILHTASGTVSKFNRIGKQCGFDENNIIMVRTVAVHNHDSNASKPIFLEYLVTEETDETWGEGISIYHNPNALYPLPHDYFFETAQHTLSGDKVVSLLPEVHVYSSKTSLIYSSSKTS